MTRHTEWLELASAYALDALDGDDKSRFERHLTGCDLCHMAVAEAAASAALLAHGVPLVDAPAGLRERIVVAAREAGPRSSAVRGEAEVGGRASESLLEFRQHRSLRRGTLATVPWLAAAASVVVAALTGFGYLAERDQSRRLIAEAERLGAQLGDAQGQVARQASILQALLAPNIATAALASTGQPPSARLYWNRDANLMVMTAFNLPAAAEGRTYQVWGIDTAAGTAPVSLGTFDSDANASATLTLVLPAGVTFDLGAVTDEPSGGSAQPTTTPFLVGSFAN